MKRMMNEATGAQDHEPDSVLWHPKSLESLRNRGRLKVLSPIVVQRSRLVALAPEEAPKPCAGLYYCLRFPLGWYLLTFRFDDFPELDHSAFWQKHAAPVLACLWAERLGINSDQLERELYTRQYAFPRGRVEGISQGVYRVLNGEDLPASISRKWITLAFGLPADIAWEKDLHETCLVEDRDYVKQRLNLTETWPAVDQPYGHVRRRTVKSE